MKNWIKQLPKAELHLHIEGSMEPEMLFRLAQRNRVKLRYHSIEELKAAYEFENLQQFLDIYYEGAKVLLNQHDFFDLTWEYLLRMKDENVRHVEIFFDPQTHTERKIPIETVITGIHLALEKAEKDFGITSVLILCFLRHLSCESAVATLKDALPFKKWIGAVGLDSSEAGHPPEKFIEVFELARKEGLEAVAHAGEEGPPEYIWQALDMLKVKRIDHGVRAIEDQKLVERLVREKIALTVCPLSNIKLRVFNSMADHSLKKLFDQGVRITLNSDDPAYFGGYLTENIFEAQAALAISKQDIVQMIENSFEASLVSNARKTALKQELRHFVASG